MATDLSALRDLLEPRETRYVLLLTDAQRRIYEAREVSRGELLAILDANDLIHDGRVELVSPATGD